MPLHFASFFGNYPMIRYLVEQGANARLKNSCDISMLHVAA
jgi:ankyrin repeat protein